MADRTLKVYEELEARRDAAQKIYWTELEAYRAWDKETSDGPRPPEPVYKGPAEWELASAKERVKQMNVHLEAGLERFRKKNETTINTHMSGSIVHEVDVKNTGTAEEVLREYHKMIEGKVE
jgi:hypothetical protein